MKKKIVMYLGLGCLMAALAGCGSKDAEVAVAPETEAAEEATAAEEEGKGSRTEEATQEETEEANAFDGPVLGGENVEGYEDFAYLYEELLMTETEENKETGKKERKQLTVYIPDDEYARADGNYAYANAMGVNFRVELEPYMRYDADDYLPEENLEYYMSNQYDPFYTAEYRDVVLTEAEEVGKDAARATAEYCVYNEWDEEYYTMFCTYYLAELEGGETVLVSVEINSSDVTGKADRLIEELEQFYQFDIDWDADRAEQKRLDYAANETENTYSTGNLLFELPKGWKEDSDISSYDMRVYSPDGDYAFAGCMIMVMEEYLGYDEEVDLQALVSDSTKESVEALVGSSIDDYSAELCKTNIGNAAKIVCTASEEGETGTVVMYVIAGKYEVYTMMAIQTDSALEDAVAALEGIVTTGQVRD